ncbi:DUF5989 family protein [Parapedobacter pyrenivorans]
MQFVIEFLGFLKHRKKYWLWPLFLILGLMAFLAVVSQGSALAPFLYTLF